MTIKIKQKSDDLISIRCNNENEMNYMLGIFLELKKNLGNHIVIKDIRGREIFPPKAVEPVQQKSPMELSEELDKKKEVQQSGNSS